jgi:circadian clock protein KaiB
MDNDSMNSSTVRLGNDSEAVEDGNYNFRLYIAGQTPKSLAAITNLKSVCEKHLKDKYRIEIVDIAKNPERAVEDQIMALPTLVRRLPEPVKRVIGTLSDMEKVSLVLDIKTGH